jgi:hypothetical protein
MSRDKASIPIMRRLLALFAILALALGPAAAIAQGAGCHCPGKTAMAAPAGHASAHTAPMPCCGHGKACAMICTLAAFTAAPAPAPAAIVRLADRAAAFEIPPDRSAPSRARDAEARPPKRIA